MGEEANATADFKKCIEHEPKPEQYSNSQFAYFYLGDNDKAPLLLGQTVLSRLGKVEIDYERSVLRITTKEVVE